MNITMTFTRDDWGRASLATVFQTDEPSHAMTFIEFGDDIWWAKTRIATVDHAYSAFYHHVNSNNQRQVIVTCRSIIQDCVIPLGFDPTDSRVASIEPYIPSTIYAHDIHALGIILFPKSATKSMRNKIWKLKDAAYTSALMPFAEALSHGRSGHSNRKKSIQPEGGPYG